MGTRHLQIVQLDGEDVISQYGQWDGYPTGQGIDVLTFLSKNFNRKKFIEQLKFAKQIDEETNRQLWIDAGDDPDNESGFVSMDISQKFKEANPQLDRDMGAEIYDWIMQQEGEYLINRFETARDAENNAWIEYSWVINLDKNQLECYEGKAVGEPWKVLTFKEIKENAYDDEDIRFTMQFWEDENREDEE